MTTSSNARLDRLMPALTFDERLDGLLAAYHADRRPDPALLRTLPAADNARWNDVADILNGLHIRLGWYIDMVESFITQLELRLALANVGRYLAGSFTHKAAEMTAAAESLDLAVVGELIQRWQDIRLAELAAERFSDELGGRRLLHPDVIAMLAKCRERMLAMRDALADPDRRSVYAFELPEPTEAHLEHLLDLLTIQPSVN